MIINFQGVCISADSGAVCECRNIDWEGEFCHIGEHAYGSFVKFVSFKKVFQMRKHLQHLPNLKHPHFQTNNFLRLVQFILKISTSKAYPAYASSYLYEFIHIGQQVYFVKLASYVKQIHIFEGAFGLFRKYFFSVEQIFCWMSCLMKTSKFNLTSGLTKV